MDSARTLQDVIFDAAYGHFYGRACSTAYGRLDFLLNLTQLVAGSGALTAAISDNLRLATSCGVLIAACAGVSLLVQPAVKAERHRVWAERFWLLRQAVTRMPLDQAEQQLAQLQAEAAPDLSGLVSAPAFNRTLDALGKSGGHMEMSWLHRQLVRLI